MCTNLLGLIAIFVLFLGMYKLYEWLYVLEEREYYGQQWRSTRRIVAEDPDDS